MHFSAHLAHLLLSQSPRHAYAEGTGAVEPSESEAMDIGAVGHALLLEGQSAVVVIDCPDFRTKLAREARDAARLAGQSPILAHRWAAVQAMAEAVRAQLANLADPVGLLEPERGVAERSYYWTEAGVECRATPDWVSLDHTVIADLKTTGASAHPAAFARTLWDKGYHLQAALYRRAVAHAHGTQPDFYFVVAETSPPYAVSVVSLDPEAWALADAQLTVALDTWRECLARHRWPAYPTRVAYAEVPGWVQAQWTARGYYQEV